MTTLFFQCAVALLALAMGVLGLKVARALPPDAPVLHRLSWEVVGLVFLLGAVSSIFQNVFAVIAVRAGNGSPAWNSYAVWAPVGNYGRTLAKSMLSLLLCLLPLAHRVTLPRARLVAIGASVVMFAVGTALGLMEGPLRMSVHFSMYSVFETVELVLLLIALFVAVQTSSMDRLLWAAMALYAARQALNALSYGALAWWGTDGRWAPSGLHIHVMGVIGYVVMAYLSWKRILLARRGVPVPGMFDLAPQPRPSLLH